MVQYQNDAWRDCRQWLFHAASPTNCQLLLTVVSLRSVLLLWLAGLVVNCFRTRSTIDWQNTCSILTISTLYSQNIQHQYLSCNLGAYERSSSGHRQSHNCQVWQLSKEISTRVTFAPPPEYAYPRIK